MVQTVTFGMAKTINTGNYENVKIHCEVTFEVMEDESLEDVYERAKQFVKDRVAEEEAAVLGRDV